MPRVSSIRGIKHWDLGGYSSSLHRVKFNVAGQ